MSCRHSDELSNLCLWESVAEHCPRQGKPGARRARVLCVWKEGIQGVRAGRHLAEKGANANLRYSSQEMPTISQAESVPAVRCLSRALAQEDEDATLPVPAKGLSPAGWTCPLT